MKVVQINSTCGMGSTGKICVAVSELLNQNNVENYILYVSGESPYSQGIKYASDKYIKLQALKSRILGNYGFNSFYTTKKLISKLEGIKPDVIHLHNLHSHNCNLQMLFSYLKRKKIKLYWTFHDCWAFTAYCPYFTMTKCNSWKTGCHQCPQKGYYSWFLDRSAFLYNTKRALFSNLDMTIVTPSQWLADLVKQSFLKGYPVKVINNGIDLSVFKPTESDFREKNNLKNKKIVLGVAFGWGRRKGLDVFIELAKKLPDSFQIVLVGTDDVVDSLLPSNVISIHRTQNQHELAEIYSAADVFVNPTREEVLGLVNVESLACGTPVITFRTGGSPECIDETCGSVVDCDDVDAMEIEIRRICEKKPYSKEACILHSKKFDKDARFKEYMELYKEIMRA